MHCPTLAELPPPSPGKTGWPWTEASPSLPDTMPDGSPWPRVSIVTPSYNQGQFLEETIRSVLLQGYPNLEYIIMDGGSTDGTLEILRKYEPFLSFLRIGPDDGQAAAIHEGLAQATGEIMAWLNSDDCYRPQTLARVANFFAVHPQIVFGNGDVNYIDSDSRLIRRIYAIKPNRVLAANLGVHGWPQPGCFWRRLAYEKVGGVDRSLHFCMDRDLFIRLTATGPGARIPASPLADFRVHDQAKSSTILDVARRENDILIAKYGDSGLQSWKWLLRLLWWFWRKPTAIRRWVQRSFGWEWQR